MTTDAIIIGGSFAGLAAATYLARGRRRVRVIDSGQPRNRFAAASHGFLGQDGANPHDILARAREQLLSYPTVDIIQGEALHARRQDDGFAIGLAGEEELSARKLILAFGLRDELPDIAGLRERWGQTVLHCPYCHGIEFSDQPLGVLYRTPMSVHQASLITQWGPVTLFLNGAVLEEAEAAELAAYGVRVENTPVAQLIGQDKALSAIGLQDGREVPLAALYVAPRSCLSSPLADQLGAEVEDGPMGALIRTDAGKMTNIPGLYAAGDIARAPHSVSWAVADGVTAGTSVHRSLVFG